MAAADVMWRLKNADVGMPLVADIHYDYRVAIRCAEVGVDKIRINPGNIGGEERVRAVVDACKHHHVPIRIGVNGGSLEKHILEKHGSPTAKALFESALFHISISAHLPLWLVWAALPVGLLCGGFAYLFGAVTHAVRGLLHKKLGKVHLFFKVAPVFAVVAIIGSVYYEGIGTGHHLIEALLAHRVAWYVALLLLVLRATLVIFANDVGATGGLFTPLLSFGALIGSVVSDVLISVGVLGEEHFLLMVVIGMTSFLAASVRTPLTAMVLAIEVFSGLGNLLPILLAVLVSYVIVEVLGANSINEIAMEREIHKENRGKDRHVVDVTTEACPGSFAIGKQPRDILWPPSCTLLSVKTETADKHFYTGGAIKENDVLRLNLITHDLDRTAEVLCDLLGEQDIFDDDVISHETYKH